MRITDTYVPKKIIGTIFADTGLDLYFIVRDEIKRYGNDANLNHIDVSRVQSLLTMFYGIWEFNGDVSLWDVSRVFNFDECFSLCGKFNCDISEWDVSRGESFKRMFYKCGSFNHDLSKWKIKDNYVSMWQMFKECPAPKPQFVIEQERFEDSYNLVK